MMTEYGLTSPVVSAGILVGLRYVYAIYYFKSIRGFDQTHSWLGAFVVTPPQQVMHIVATVSQACKPARLALASYMFPIPRQDLVLVRCGIPWYQPWVTKHAERHQGHR